MARISRRTSVYVLFSAILIATSVAWGQGIGSLTRPGWDVQLSFVSPGIIAEISVAEGDLVEAGQLLLRQDDEAEQLQLAQLKAEAEDETRIEATQAELDLKKVNFEQIEWAYKRDAVAKFEYRQARLDVKIAGLRLRLSKFEHQQNKRKYMQAQAQFARMRITSPIDGMVEEIVGYLEVGESADALQPVIRVVNINPLRIRVDAPMSEVRSLKAGKPAWVTFEGAEGGVVQGKIIFVSSVAEAGSSTLRVEVEVPNDAGRPAGEEVQVSFEKPE